MDISPEQQRFFKMACYFEASLVLVAIVLGAIAEINPFEYLDFSESALFYGIFGALPLMVIFVALYQMQLTGIQNIQKLLAESLASKLYNHHWTDLLVLGMIAGIGEELLFRGVIQPWLESSWGMMAGLLVSNIIFGLVHAITPLYFALAMLCGLYLGLSLDYDGQRNVLTPILIHGCYDFFAFVLIMRQYRTTLPQ